MQEDIPIHPPIQLYSKICETLFRHTFMCIYTVESSVRYYLKLLEDLPLCVAIFNSISDHTQTARRCDFNSISVDVATDVANSVVLC